ncbi:MAG: efflux transporter outer membrane subunit [Candidatus Aminicenantes bacterium]|jgi:multidrug efflux system outer membrane protein
MKYCIKIITLFTILGLTGCLVGPDYQKPVVETPQYYQFDPAKDEFWTDLQWWALFDDPVLISYVNTALSGNKNVKIAASRIEEARAALGFTEADSYPRIDIEALVTRGNLAGVAKTESPQTNIYIAPVVNWEIDFWGKYRRANESALAQLLASEFSLRTIQISLIADVVSTYFLILDYRQRLAVSKRTLESRMESLDIMQKRFDKGIIPELDLNQAQIQKEIAAAAIPFYERLLSQTENVLSILLGRPPGKIESGADLNDQTMPPDIPPGLPSSLLERRPDIVQSEYLLKAQNARIGVAEALRLPSISLTGILGVASNELSSLTSDGAAWSITGSLFGPIFNFNKNIRRVEIEEERTKQAYFNYENTVLQAFREVEDALVEVKTYRDQLDAVQNKLKAARNAAFLSGERYDKGVTSYLEVLETQRTLFNVELELSELNKDYLNAYVKLYKALGGGWISKEEMEEVQNPKKK